MPQAQLPNTMGALSSQRHDGDDIGTRRRRTLGYQPHPGWTQSSRCGGKDFLKRTPVLLRHLSSVVFVFLMFLALCSLASLAQLEGCPVFWKLQEKRKKSKKMCFLNLGWDASPQDGPPPFSLAYEKTHLQKWDLVHQGRTQHFAWMCKRWAGCCLSRGSEQSCG